MKDIKEFICESDERNVQIILKDNNGRPEYNDRFAITFDEVVMLIHLFEELNITEDNFKKMFGTSYSFKEYERLFNDLKNYKKNYRNK